MIRIEVIYNYNEHHVTEYFNTIHEACAFISVVMTDENVTSLEIDRIGDKGTDICGYCK
jgi:hypothetical protein